MLQDKILKQLDQLDDDLNLLLEDLNAFSDEDLKKAPTADVWSPLQLLQHIYLAEKVSLDYVIKKSKYSADLEKAGLQSSLRATCLTLGLKVPMKFKAIGPVGAKAFDHIASYEWVKQQFVQERIRLRGFLEELDDVLLDKAVYLHPIVGKLTISQMLTFFSQHFVRHKRQLYQRL